MYIIVYMYIVYYILYIVYFRYRFNVFSDASVHFANPNSLHSHNTKDERRAQELGRLAFYIITNYFLRKHCKKTRSIEYYIIMAILLYKNIIVLIQYLRVLTVFHHLSRNLFY